MTVSNSYQGGDEGASNPLPISVVLQCSTSELPLKLIRRLFVKKDDFSDLRERAAINIDYLKGSTLDIILEIWYKSHIEIDVAPIKNHHY